MSSAGAASEKKMIVLKSFDGKTFEVEEAVALESQTIKQMIENNCADTSIPLPDVTSKIMAKVIEYCKRHVDSAAKSSNDEVIVADLKLFDAEFVKVDRRTLIDLTMAAWHLNIKGLLDLTCQGVADMMTGMTTEEIRKTLNIKKDLSREEEEEIRRMHAWAFQRRKTFQRRKRRFAG